MLSRAFGGTERTARPAVWRFPKTIAAVEPVDPQVRVSGFSCGTWRNGAQPMGGERDMADFSDGELSRVALGTFDRLDRLDQILTELASGIVDAGQVCVLAAEPRLRRREPTDSADSMPLFQTLFEKQRRVAVLANGEHLVAAPDDFIGLDFELERNADGLLHGLDARLINGVLALLVTTRTVPEFIAVTRLMLRFSSHSVRTREVVHHPIS